MAYIGIYAQTLRLAELKALLFMEPDQASPRAQRIERALLICSDLDARWWANIGRGKSAEDLIAYFNQPPPRRLPPIPYEDWPQ